MIKIFVIDEMVQTLKWFIFLNSKLKTLIISSEGEIPEGYKVGSDNMLNIPFETVRSVKDMVMVKIWT